MRRYEPIAGITVGASGSDSTIPVPVNRRLLAIRLFAEATAAGPTQVFGANVIDGIQIYVGTRLVRDLTAVIARLSTAAWMLWQLGSSVYDRWIGKNNHLGIYHGRDRAALVDAKTTSGIKSATRNDSGGISGG